jgi:hypothetical protein
MRQFDPPGDAVQRGPGGARLGARSLMLRSPQHTRTVSRIGRITQRGPRFPVTIRPSRAPFQPSAGMPQALARLNLPGSLLRGPASRSRKDAPPWISPPCAPATPTTGRRPAPSACWRSMPWRRPIRAIPACRWAWPMWPRCCSTKHLKFDARAPHWADRDRFILSAGPWLDAALCAAASDRLCRHDAGPDEELPPMGRDHRGPPRIRPCDRGRNHHRPAGSGHRQCRGLCHGRRIAARPLGREDPGPPHLGHRRRRLPDGGVSHEAIGLAGRQKLDR